MRFVLDQSVIDMRAKSVTDSEFTKSETMDVMNWLSIVFDKAAEKYEQEGNTLLAHIARQNATQIYNKLRDEHYYS